VTFSFWSLDFIYYPVSGIMWVWHKVFGSFMGYSNPWAWVLSVMFLVFTLRAIMFKPFMKQMDASLKMQAIQPEMKKIREKYKDDRQRLTEEMMKLNKEAGVNPLASCLPALLQAPAFIGLFHVLRNFIYAFNPHLTKPDLPATTINNYFFPASDVTSFHDALLFGGASLSAHLTMPATSNNPLVTSLADLGSNRATMLAVGIPLMILAAFATHLSSRKSIARQAQLGTAAVGGQAAIMQKLMLWGFPLGVLFIGAFYPLALLFYWLANNTWTFGQLFVAHRIQDRKLAEEAKVVDAAKDSTSFSTPKPGARPSRDPKAGTIKPSLRVADGVDPGPDDKGASKSGPKGGPASKGQDATRSGAAGGSDGSGGARGAESSKGKPRNGSDGKSVASTPADGKSAGGKPANSKPATGKSPGGSGSTNGSTQLNGEFLPPAGAKPRPGKKPNRRPKR